jgi:hypothetical protein
MFEDLKSQKNQDFGFRINENLPAFMAPYLKPQNIFETIKQKDDIDLGDLKKVFDMLQNMTESIAEIK